jgi:hypothetical protein
MFRVRAEVTFKTELDLEFEEETTFARMNDALFNVGIKTLKGYLDQNIGKDMMNIKMISIEAIPRERMPGIPNQEERKLPYKEF